MTTSEDIINERAYEKYRSFALPTIVENNPYLLKKGWLVQTGLSVIPPHRYRHYTIEEFIKKSKDDKEFTEFYNLLFSKAQEEYFQEIVERLSREL